MGGRDDHKPISSVHVYDCYKKTWSKVSDMRKSRESPAVAVSTFAKEQTGTFCTWCSLGVGAGTSEKELKSWLKKKTQRRIVSFGRYFSPCTSGRSCVYLAVNFKFVNVIVFDICEQVSIFHLF